MITTLTSVAILDLTQQFPNVFVRLENIMEGVDGAAAFGLTIEKAALTVSNNQELQYKHTYTFDVRVIDPSNADIDLLQVMVDEQRPVKISGYGPDGFLIIDEPVLLNYNRQFDQIVAMPILATITATSGYQGTAPNTKLPVYAGDNALGVYDVTGGSASVLNGFANPVGLTTTQTGGVQTIIRASSGGGTTPAFARLFFPFPNVELTASIVTEPASGSRILSLIYFTSFSSSQTNSPAFDFTSKVTVTGTTPNDVVFISLGVNPGSTNGDELIFSKPMIGLNGKTQFTL